MAAERNYSYGHVLKYTGIFGGVQGMSIAISLLRNKLVAMLLGPAGMGMASLLNTTVSFISQATNFGISFSAIKHISEIFDSGDEERIRHFVKVVRSWSLLTALLGMLVCAAAGPDLRRFVFSGLSELNLLLLSPAVGLAAITGGETAILKGARRLKSLAMTQIISMVSALIISIPIYYFFGLAGIVPAIVLMAVASMLITVWYSYRLYPLRLSCNRSMLFEGFPMVRLGIGFLVAGVMGSGAELLIRFYLSMTGGNAAVGLYNAGFMLTMTYGGMVFSAMETDYFPRLSAVNRDTQLCNQTVNRQIEVSLLIISPMLVAFIFAAQEIVPLLFTEEFNPVVPMLRVTVLALYLRALKLPVAYLTLAKGDSMSYMILEAIYDVVMVLLVIVGYNWLGLVGTGVALLAVALFDFVMVNGYTRLRYKFRLSGSIARYALPHIALGLVAFASAWLLHGIYYWLTAIVLSAASLAFSVAILHRKTSLWNSLKDKLYKKIHPDA